MKPSKKEIALHKANDVSGLAAFKKRSKLDLAEALRVLQETSGHIPPGRPGGANTATPRMRTADIDLRKTASELVARVIWALKFMRPKDGPGASVFLSDTASTQPWDEWFMDGLDMVGYVVDRKKFHAARDGNPKVKKPRKTK